MEVVCRRCFVELLPGKQMYRPESGPASFLSHLMRELKEGETEMKRPFLIKWFTLINQSLI